MAQVSGRVPSAPGSREPSPSGLGPPGFDPSRTFGFSEVTVLVMRANGEPPVRFIATAGTVKYLQRQGAAPSYALGRGKAARYTHDDAWMILIAAELHAAGLTPIQITPLMEGNRETIREAIRLGTAAVLRVPSGGGRIIKMPLDLPAIALALRFPCGSDENAEVRS